MKLVWFYAQMGYDVHWPLYAVWTVEFCSFSVIKKKKIKFLRDVTRDDDYRSMCNWVVHELGQISFNWLRYWLKIHIYVYMFIYIIWLPSDGWYHACSWHLFVHHFLIIFYYVFFGHLLPSLFKWYWVLSLWCIRILVDVTFRSKKSVKQ